MNATTADKLAITKQIVLTPKLTALSPGNASIVARQVTAKQSAPIRKLRDLSLGLVDPAAKKATRQQNVLASLQTSAG